ncbi:MAG: Uncharacterised protein [Arcobacter lacus]|nr:MAG: Uncharacterised protein [Arcobacter lacus]
MIYEFFFAALASLGFAMLFNVPKHALIYCFFGGAVSHTLKETLMSMGLSIEFATFISATVIGVIALYYSRKNVIPRPVYTVASIIPLIPGTYAFTAIITLVDINTHGVDPQLINIFVENFLKSLAILGAISFGIAIPSLYFLRYNRPII